MNSMRLAVEQLENRDCPSALPGVPGQWVVDTDATPIQKYHLDGNRVSVTHEVPAWVGEDGAYHPQETILDRTYTFGLPGAVNGAPSAITLAGETLTAYWQDGGQLWRASGPIAGGGAWMPELLGKAPSEADVVSPSPLPVQVVLPILQEFETVTVDGLNLGYSPIPVANAPPDLRYWGPRVVDDGEIDPGALYLVWVDLGDTGTLSAAAIESHDGGATWVRYLVPIPEEWTSPTTWLPFEP